MWSKRSKSKKENQGKVLYVDDIFRQGLKSLAFDQVFDILELHMF